MKSKRLFCNHCSSRLVERTIDGKPRSYCESCEAVFYENPLPVVSAIVVNENRELLLVKRGNDPYRGMWCLPIGFAEAGESISEAALRELREETGLEGEIARLVDVDTIDDEYYGSMAVITYEVRVIGGRLEPGDDAVDARYVPINETPPLAWKSNTRAVRAYLDLHRDTWAMMDSYRQLFSDMDDDIEEIESKEGKAFLSNVLVRVIERNVDEITSVWMNDMAAKIEKTGVSPELFEEIHREAIREVANMLRGKKGVFDSGFFFNAGRKLKRQGVSMPVILTAMALSRKSIWTQFVERRVYKSPREVYISMELNNRIIFLYDRVNYHLSMGYSLPDESNGLNSPNFAAQTTVS